MKNNYIAINVKFLNYEIDRFKYLKERDPAYLIMNSDTLHLMKGKKFGEAEKIPVAINSELRIGEIVLL